MFSGVKDCQKGGGAGKAAARTFCCCCSSISVLLPWPQAARDDLDPAIRISRVNVHATAFEWCWWWWYSGELELGLAGRHFRTSPAGFRKQEQGCHPLEFWSRGPLQPHLTLTYLHHRFLPVNFCCSTIHRQNSLPNISSFCQACQTLLEDKDAAQFAVSRAGARCENRVDWIYC
jgi:hypothetical protein